MRVPVLAALAALALLLPAPAAADEPRRLMTMTGLGEVRDVPDLATISTGIITEARTAAAALSANTTAMSETVAGLKAAGIADRDLQTSDFRVSPVYNENRNRNEPPRIVGYSVSNRLTVVVRDLERLGEILDAVVQDGANRISGPTFGFAEPEAKLDVARARAAADAERKAKLYADVLGLDLGPIVSVNEDGGFRPQPQPIQARMAAMEAAVPPIESGELSLSIRATVTWELR